MSRFFRGWRRKIGLLTLVLAFILTGGWARSFHVYDSVAIPSGDQTYHLLFSLPNWIGWIRVHNPKGRVPAQIRSSYGWETGSSDEFNSEDPYTPFSAVYYHPESKGNGVTYIQSSEENPHLIIPYWSVVVPMILLSAYFLLSKPRPSIPKKITEPVARKGA